jgi:uncharacterized membrane protein YraQ (UPF0718 family)
MGIFSTILSFFKTSFTNIKVILLAIVGALIAGYVVSENIKRKKAEAKLIDIQNKVLKTQIDIIKTEAKIASETKDIEMETHTQLLNDLERNKVTAKLELEEITKRMNETADHNGKVGLFSFDGLTPVKDKV